MRFRRKRRGDEVEEEFSHLPVMAREVVELLLPVPGGMFVDCTVGGGGHSAALLDARPDVRVLGLDRDVDAVEAARSRLARFGDRARVVHGGFERLGMFVERHGEGEKIMGILMDLGVSSAQLDRPERGFSFRFDAPLDMRMDSKQSLTATEVVNGYEESQLSAVLSQYGEERFARRIARAIVAARPVRSTRELAEIVRDAIPAATRRRGPHPARRTFQAIRMEVNRELPNLADGLDESVHVIGPRACARSSGWPTFPASPISPTSWPEIPHERATVPAAPPSPERNAASGISQPRGRCACSAHDRARGGAAPAPRSTAHVGVGAR